mmetsp:Transcript_60544/g.118706  ORF Transcript_60544/g.118706 Transcript_60544/m.118706 type:complete len:347 (-) Transcript_60544:395-1435(-)
MNPLTVSHAIASSHRPVISSLFSAIFCLKLDWLRTRHRTASNASATAAVVVASLPPPNPPCRLFAVVKEEAEAADADDDGIVSALNESRMLRFCSATFLPAFLSTFRNTPSPPLSAPLNLSSNFSYSATRAHSASSIVSASSSPPLPAAAAPPVATTPFLASPPLPPPPLLPAPSSSSMASRSRFNSSAINVCARTSLPCPLAKCRSTKPLSTTSCDDAAGMRPVIIVFKSVMGTLFLSPATLRVGAYTIKPLTSIPRLPARPAICQNSSGLSQRWPRPPPSSGLSSCVNTTVRAGMFTPTARVSVANTIFTRRAWKHSSTYSLRMGSMPAWWYAMPRFSRSLMSV